MSSSVSNFTGSIIDFSSEGVLERQMKRLIDSKAADRQDDDIIRSVVRAIRYIDSPSLQHTALLVAVQISENDDNKNMLVDYDAVEAIVSLADGEERVQYSVARCLWQFAKLDRNRLVIIRQGGLTAIYKIALSKGAHPQFAALRALSYITESEELREAVMKTQIPDALAGPLLRSQAEQVQYVAAVNIQNLAKTETHVTFMDKELHSYLCMLAKTAPQNPRLAAVGAIQNLVRNVIARRSLIEQGLVSVMIDCTQSNITALQEIALSVLSTVSDDISENERKIILSLLWTLLKAEDLKIKSAASGHLLALSAKDDVKKAILQKAILKEVVSWLNTEATELLAFDLLFGLIDKLDFADQFSNVGGVQIIIELVKSDRQQAQQIGVLLIWALVQHGKFDATITDGAGSLLTKFVTSHPRIEARYSSFVITALLASPGSGSMDCIIQYVRRQSAIHAELPRLVQPLTQSSVPLLLCRGTGEAKLAAVWILSNLLKKNVSAFTSLDGQLILEQMAMEEGSEHGILAKGMLGSQPIPGAVDFQSNVDKIFEALSAENSAFHRLKNKAKEALIDVTARYNRNDSLGKLKYCKPHPLLTPDVNNKLKLIGIFRLKLDSVSRTLEKKVNQLLQKLAKIESMHDTLLSMQAKAGDRKYADALKESIEQLKRAIDSASASIEEKLAHKAGLQCQKDDLLKKLSQRSGLEQERLKLLSQQEEVIYQINNYDKIVHDLQDQLNGISSRLSELLSEQQRHDQEMKSLEAKLYEAQVKINSAAEKSVKYDRTRSSVENFKTLRADMKSKYGRELHELVLFHKFLNGLMEEGSNYIRELDPTFVTPSATNPEQAASTKDFGAKAEVELTEKLSELYSAIEKEKLDAKRDHEKYTGEIKALNTKIEMNHLEADRLTRQKVATDARLRQLVSRQSLEAQRDRLGASISEIDEVIDELSKIDFTSLDAQIDEKVKLIGKENAHKRFLENELAALQRQLKQRFNALEGDMEEFGALLREAQMGRINQEIRLNIYRFSIGQWTSMFAAEKEMCKQGEAMVASDIAGISLALQEIGALHSGVKSMLGDALVGRPEKEKN